MPIDICVLTHDINVPGICIIFSTMSPVVSAIVRSSRVSALHLSEHDTNCGIIGFLQAVVSWIERKWERVKERGRRALQTSSSYIHSRSIWSFNIFIQYNHERQPLMRSAISKGTFIKPSFRFNYFTVTHRMKICQINKGYSTKSTISDSTTKMKCIYSGKWTTRLFTFPKIR